MRMKLIFFGGALLLSTSGCDTKSEPSPAVRGEIGKADLIGSCEESTCDGASQGNCWCDDECEAFGDCCSDYEAACISDTPPTCGGLSQVQCEADATCVPSCVGICDCACEGSDICDGCEGCEANCFSFSSCEPATGDGSETGDDDQTTDSESDGGLGCAGLDEAACGQQAGCVGVCSGICDCTCEAGDVCGGCKECSAECFGFAQCDPA